MVNIVKNFYGHRISEFALGQDLDPFLGTNRANYSFNLVIFLRRASIVSRRYAVLRCATLKT